MGELEYRVSSSAPLSQVHPSPQVPEHADSTDRIDSTRTWRLMRSTTAVIPKVERPRHTQLHLIFLRFCAAGTPSSSARGASPSRAFLASETALALLRESLADNDIMEDDGGDVVVFRVPFATSPASPPRSARPSSGDAGGRSHFKSGFGVVRHDGDPPRLLISPSSSELSTSWSFLSLFAPLRLAKSDSARVTPPIALHERAPESKFSRRPHGSCSIGAAKLVSPACDALVRW